MEKLEIRSLDLRGNSSHSYDVYGLMEAIISCLNRKVVLASIKTKVN